MVHKDAAGKREKVVREGERGQARSIGTKCFRAAAGG